MPSGTLSFDQVGKRLFYPALFRKNLKRFWPVWAAYLAIWGIALPLNVLTSARYHDVVLVLDYLQFGIILSAFWGLFSAMAVFSYLYNPRAAGTLHALPVRREGLFLTNWLSGFSFLTLPHVAVFLFTLAAQALTGPVDLLALVLWLLTMCLTGLFFYSFAVFCAMFTGNLVALPVFYGILNFLVLGLTQLLQELMRQFLFGFSGSADMTDLAVWFTPAVQLFRQVYPISRGGGAGPLHGFAYVLLYAAAGIVFTVLALLVYRKRHLESAGDIVSVPWVRPIFKYGVAFCSAVAFGTFLYSFLFGALPDNAWAILAFLLLWGLVGYFAAEMLLRKSFRVFRRSWKGACAFALALAVGCCALEFDLMGFERWNPDPDSLSWVRIWTTSAIPYDSGSHTPTLTEPEDLEALARFQASVIAHKEELETYRAGYESTALNPMDPGGWVVTQEKGFNLELEYMLQSGRLVTREYSFPVTPELLADPDSPAALLQELINSPTVIKAAYFESLVGQKEEGELVRVSLNTYDPATGEQGDQTLSGQELERLLDAVLADMDAGRLGRHWLINTPEMYDVCYYNDLTFTFYFPYVQDDGTNDSFSIDVTITLQTTAAETIAALEELGLTDGGHVLLTYNEYRALQRAGEGGGAEDPADTVRMP